MKALSSGQRQSTDRKKLERTLSERETEVELDPSRTPARGTARRPTMRQVAAVAGVSLSTVSRAVRDDPNVDPELVRRVQDAIAVTGYRRDLNASTLRRADRVSASIGVVIEDLGNPFFAAMSRGVEEVVRGRSVLMLAGSSDADPERERGLSEAFLDRRVDGLVVTPTGLDQSYLTRDRDAGVPIVFIDRPPSFIDADVVLSDNVGGSRGATEHLIAQGHRRIGFLGDRLEVFTAAERLRGYRDALATTGRSVDEALVRTGLRSSAESEFATMDFFRSADPPTALFTAQNEVAVGALRALRRLDLHRRVALISFDDLELADLIDPGLTVMAQDPAELGRAAARLLFQRMDGDETPYRRVELPTRLILRGSGEIPVRSDDA